ncbi:hypothetical protein [Glaciecola petra]|uniref:Uncharacterized protein n=1 Tax=Glaciecola petra TaxID=3075602 RepID=A0ABU2ZVF0_9ALTE|nr:hypothetical protein [Aestuariibacter sp. P117]MDT0596627.1 hypothetical protein [Aestuariibacter sp. P117]
MTTEQVTQTKVSQPGNLVTAKNLSLAATLVLIIVVGVVNALLPEFIDIFEGLGAELPTISLWVINTFNFWWVFPGITLVFFIAIQTHQLSQKPQIVDLSKKVAIGGFVSAALILILTFVAIYSPAYSAG